MCLEGCGGIAAYEMRRIGGGENRPVQERRRLGAEAGEVGDVGGEERWGYGLEGGGELGLREEGLEVGHFGVGEGGKGVVVGANAVAGLGFVGEEVFDEGEGDNEPTFLLCGMDEDDGGDEDAFDNLGFAAGVVMRFSLGGDVGFVAELVESVAAGFFGVVGDNSNVPVFGHVGDFLGGRENRPAQEGERKRKGEREERKRERGGAGTGGKKGGLFQFFDVEGGDGDGGGTEEVEGDEDVGAVGVAEVGAFETLEVATDDADWVAELERGVDEGDGGIGIVEHEAESIHLVVGDDGEGSTTTGKGEGCLVCHEELDVGGGLEELKTLRLCNVDKDDAGDDDAGNFTTMAIAVDVGLLLAGNVGFVAKRFEVFAAEFFAIALNNGYIPLGGGYASGKRLAHMFSVLR